MALFKCPWCDYEGAQFKRHAYTRHKDLCREDLEKGIKEACTMGTIKDVRHKCRICGVETVRIRRHVVMQHKDLSLVEMKAEIEKSKSMPMVKEVKPLGGGGAMTSKPKCRFCGKEDYKLRRHLMTHHKELSADDIDTEVSKFQIRRRGRGKVTLKQTAELDQRKSEVEVGVDMSMGGGGEPDLTSLEDVPEVRDEVKVVVEAAESGTRASDRVDRGISEASEEIRVKVEPVDVDYMTFIRDLLVGGEIDPPKQVEDRSPELPPHSVVHVVQVHAPDMSRSEATESEGALLQEEEVAAVQDKVCDLLVGGEIGPLKQADDRSPELAGVQEEEVEQEEVPAIQNKVPGQLSDFRASSALSVDCPRCHVRVKQTTFRKHLCSEHGEKGQKASETIHRVVHRQWALEPSVTSSFVKSCRREIDPKKWYSGEGHYSHSDVVALLQSIGVSVRVDCPPPRLRMSAASTGEAAEEVNGVQRTEILSKPFARTEGSPGTESSGSGTNADDPELLQGDAYQARRMVGVIRGMRAKAGLSRKRVRVVNGSDENLEALEPTPGTLNSDVEKASDEEHKFQPVSKRLKVIADSDED